MTPELPHLSNLANGESRIPRSSGYTGLAALCIGIFCVACGDVNDDATPAPEAEASVDPDDGEDVVGEQDNPPANWAFVSSVSAPTKLEVTAHSSDNSGSSGDLVLEYWNLAGKYTCTITESIGDGQTKSCVPTKYGSAESGLVFDEFKVEFSPISEDGLRITAVTATIDGTSYVHGTYWIDPYDANFNITCAGCVPGVGAECNSCWIDGDGHSDCTRIDFAYQDYYFNTYCREHS